MARPGSDRELSNASLGVLKATSQRAARSNIVASIDVNMIYVIVSRVIVWCYL